MQRGTNHKQSTIAILREKNLNSRNPRWKGGKFKKLCPICGALIFYWPSQERKYCSRSCFAMARRKNV